MAAGLVSVVGCQRGFAYQRVRRGPQTVPQGVEPQIQEGLAPVPLYNEGTKGSVSHGLGRVHRTRGRGHMARSRAHQRCACRREDATHWLSHPRGSLCSVRQARSRYRRTFGREGAQDDPRKATRVVTGGGRDFSVPASLTRHARCRPGRRPRSATRLKTALRLPDGVAAATDMGMGNFRLDAAPQSAIAL